MLNDVHPERMLTVADIAKRTKSSLWFVRSQIRDGHLHARHLGHSRLLRVTQDDFERWLEGDDGGACPREATRVGADQSGGHIVPPDCCSCQTGEQGLPTDTGEGAS